jgi:hypothetical protein
MSYEDMRIIRNGYGEGVAAMAALGYTDDEGRAACVAHVAELDEDTAEGVFSRAEYRRAGDHRGGCGLSCDTCGAVIVSACSTCTAGIV